MPPRPSLREETTMSVERMKRVGRTDRRSMRTPVADPPARPKKSLYPSSVTRFKSRQEEIDAEKNATAVVEKPSSANYSVLKRAKSREEMKAIEETIEKEEVDEAQKLRKTTSISDLAGIVDMGADEEREERQAETVAPKEATEPEEKPIPPGEPVVETGTGAEVPSPGENDAIGIMDTSEHFAKLTVKEIKAFAEEYVIDIDKQLTKKADIVDCVTKAFEVRIKEANGAEPWTELLQKTMDYYGAIVRTTNQ